MHVDETGCAGLTAGDAMTSTSTQNYQHQSRSDDVWSVMQAYITASHLLCAFSADVLALAGLIMWAEAVCRLVANKQNQCWQASKTFCCFDQLLL